MTVGVKINSLYSTEKEDYRMRLFLASKLPVNWDSNNLGLFRNRFDVHPYPRVYLHEVTNLV